MEKKEPLGFKTPSMRIQEEYKEILEELLAKKANWEKLFDHCKKMFNFDFEMASSYLSKGVKDIDNLTDIERMEFEHRVMNVGQGFAMLFIAKIGKELSECDVRISTIEKELKEIKRCIK